MVCHLVSKLLPCIPLQSLTLTLTRYCVQPSVAIVCKLSVAIVCNSHMLSCVILAC